MTSLRYSLDACDAAVRGHLDPDEQPLAVGRCEDISERGSIDQGGGAWTYVMVTNRRLRWVPHADLRFETSLDLDLVTSVSEESQSHRYAIALEHAPLARAHWVPAHRLLIFEWGNAIGTEAMIRTKLAFSRCDTVAAEAMRAQLAQRQLL